MTYQKILLFAVILKFGEAEVLIDRYIGRCKEYPNTPAEVTNVKIERTNRETFLSHAWTVKRPIERFDKIIIMATKCASADGGDYCESFRNFSLNNFDAILQNPASPWGHMFEYDPPLHFPLKPGKYISKRQRIDNSIAVFSLKGYWKVKVVGFTTNGQPMICMQVAGSVS